MPRFVGMATCGREDVSRGVKGRISREAWKTRYLMLAMPSAVSVWAGCVTDGASGNGVEVTDSPGIRVVTHHGVERPVGSLGDAPLLSIGTVQDDGITATEWRVFGADGRSVGALVYQRGPRCSTRPGTDCSFSRVTSLMSSRSSCGSSACQESERVLGRRGASP
jgi:hypothetical protein